MLGQNYPLKFCHKAGAGSAGRGQTLGGDLESNPHGPGHPAGVFGCTLSNGELGTC